MTDPSYAGIYRGTPKNLIEESLVVGALKFDSDKPMMDLVLDGLPNALLGVGSILTYGYKKYGGKHGWKSLDDAEARYKAAMLRHELAHSTGEVLDPESGYPHRLHIACNALFLAELEILKGKQIVTPKHNSQPLLCDGDRKF